jgi:uncharacterized protein (DUF488 family)
MSRLDHVTDSRPLASVGYANFTLNTDMAARLRAAGVESLIDVRALASSRRRGFAKTALSSALADRGIEYVHMRALGNPKAGRELYRRGAIEEGRALFERHLLGEQRGALEELARVIAQRRCALMCVEADPALCHRTAIIDALRSELGLALEVTEISP